MVGASLFKVGEHCGELLRRQGHAELRGLEESGDHGHASPQRLFVQATEDRGGGEAGR